MLIYGSQRIGAMEQTHVAVNGYALTTSSEGIEYFLVFYAIFLPIPDYVELLIGPHSNFPENVFIFLPINLKRTTGFGFENIQFSFLETS